MHTCPPCSCRTRYYHSRNAGNIEIHLIKGTPVVPTGDHLVVGHLSLETTITDIDSVAQLLKDKRVPFSKNVRCGGMCVSWYQDTRVHMPRPQITSPFL